MGGLRWMWKAACVHRGTPKALVGRVVLRGIRQTAKRAKGFNLGESTCVAFTKDRYSVRKACSM